MLEKRFGRWGAPHQAPQPRGALDCDDCSAWVQPRLSSSSGKGCESPGGKERDRETEFTAGTPRCRWNCGRDGARTATSHAFFFFSFFKFFFSLMFSALAGLRGPDPAMSRARGQPPAGHRVSHPSAPPAPGAAEGQGTLGAALTWDGQVGERRAVDAVGQGCHPVGETQLVLALRRSHAAAVPLPLSHRQPLARSLVSAQPSPSPSPARPGPARLRPPGTAPLLAASPPRGRRPLTPRRAPLAPRCRRPPEGLPGSAVSRRGHPGAASSACSWEGAPGEIGCLLCLRASSGVGDSPLSSAGGGLNKCLLCWDRWPPRGFSAHDWLRLLLI